MGNITNRIKGLNNSFNYRHKEGLSLFHYFSPVRIKINEFPFLIPDDLKAFYEDIGYAELFVDGVYGQGGVRVFNAYQSLQATYDIQTDEGIELLKDELIIGDFLGDSDRILLSNNKITIIFPIYGRNDWLVTGLTFGDFLSRIIDNNGEKYWEL